MGGDPSFPLFIAARGFCSSISAELEADSPLMIQIAMSSIHGCSVYDGHQFPQGSQSKTCQTVSQPVQEPFISIVEKTFIFISIHIIFHKDFSVPPPLFITSKPREKRIQRPLGGNIPNRKNVKNHSENKWYSFHFFEQWKKDSVHP